VKQVREILGGLGRASKGPSAVTDLLVSRR
jgi:hypothetical protein